VEIIARRLCLTGDFVQDQSLSHFETATSRKRSGFEDLEVAKMQLLGQKNGFAKPSESNIRQSFQPNQGSSSSD